MKPLFPWSIFRAYESPKLQSLKRGLGIPGNFMGNVRTVHPPHPAANFNAWMMYIITRKA